MIRTGAIVLSLWTGANLILSLGILFWILVLGHNAPALTILYEDTLVVGMDPRALATINGMAVILNACSAAICALSLAVIWVPLLQKQAWAFWGLSGSLLFLQAAGFASDSFFHHKDLPLNIVSSLLLLSGIVLAGAAIFRNTRWPNQSLQPTAGRSDV